jgi:hypothetical protein
MDRDDDDELKKGMDELLVWISEGRLWDVGSDESIVPELSSSREQLSGLCWTGESGTSPGGCDRSDW